MKTKTNYKTILYIIAALLLSLFCCIESALSIKARADDTVVLKIDNTNVMDDLKELTVEGEPFDITDYAFDELRDVQVISFVEYCYSYNQDKQDYFGLYVYIWNPKGLSFENDDTRNRIQFSYGEYIDTPAKYPFTILNKSEESGYEGMFYKLRVDLTDEEKTFILGAVNSVARTYKVSGIEILETGKAIADDYPISTTFTYSGFSQGFGSDDATTSTLKCTRDTYETLGLDVFHTYYRPNGTNGENSYTRDTLMSVYFSIPNKVLDDYDRLSGIACSWIKVMTDWIYVTGREDIYKAYLARIGKTGWTLDDNGTPGLTSDDTMFPYGFCATTVDDENVVKCNYSGESADETLDRLNYIFWTGSTSENSADNFILDKEKLYTWMFNYQTFFGQAGDDYLRVDGSDYTPYNANLFEYPRANTTYATVYADEEYSLTEEVITANWWQKMWGDTTLEYSDTFDNIKAIKKVTAADMSYTDNILCKTLYIDEYDITHFKQFYEAEKIKGNTVFLLRYDIGAYQSIETRQGEPDNEGFLIGFDNGDTNGYVSREHVYLNFDIIHCEFEKNGETIVIPVVSSPIDIIVSPEPPLNTTDDTEWGGLKKILRLILIIVVATAGLALLSCIPGFGAVISLIFNAIFKAIGFVLKWVFKILWWVILFPFNLIGKLFKRNKRKKNE